MQLVCASGLFPFPTDIGTAIHVWGLAEALDQAFDVRFVFLRRAETTDAHLEEVRGRLRGTVEAFAPPSPPGGRAAAVVTWGRAALRGAPPWVIEEWSAPMARRLAALAGKGPGAVVLLYDRGLYALSLPRRPAPVVTVRHEIEGWTLREAKLRDVGGRDRIRIVAARPLVELLERRMLRRCDVVAVTSQEEEERMRTLYGRDADALVPAAIRPQPRWEPHSGPPVIGYLGSLDYGPNVHGLERFVSEGWAQVPPPARLVLAGRSPGPEILALEEEPRIEVREVSEEFDAFLPQFLEQVQVAIAPLWSGGAGVKVKTLTMLGAGIPSVLTPAAAQGLPVEDGIHCSIAETPAELARAAARLLDDRGFAARLGAAGRELVNSEYVWPVVGPRFSRFVEAQVKDGRRWTNER